MFAQVQIKGKGLEWGREKTVTKVATLESESLRVNIINVSFNFSISIKGCLTALYHRTEQRSILRKCLVVIWDISHAQQRSYGYIFSQMIWIIQMKVPIAKRTDENDNFSVANDPDHPNELACCKKDGPEQLFCCKWSKSSKWTGLLQKGWTTEQQLFCCKWSK